MKMKKLLCLLMVGLLAFSLAACNPTATNPPANNPPTNNPPTTPPADGSDKIHIGIIASTTGPLAVFGNSVVNAANMAAEEINAAGGVLGKEIVFDVLDDRSDTTEAANAFNKLKSDGVCAILGPITSGISAGVATLANEQGMLMLTPTATDDALTPAPSNVFRVCYKDSFQGTVAARFAINDLGVKKVAVLYASGDPYSTGLYEAFKTECEANNVEIVKVESSSAISDTDFNTQLTTIAATDAELIFAPYYYDSIGPYIIPQAREAGFEGYFLGPDGYDGTIPYMLEDKALYNNTYFVNHYSPEDPSELVQHFVTSYTAKYGTELLNALAALGYDAANLLFKTIEKAQTTDTAALIEAMRGASFEGVTGSFTLDANGSPEKSVAIMEFKDGAAIWKATVE